MCILLCKKCSEHPWIFFRDIFYELVREWEDCNSATGWNMEDHMGDRIRYLKWNHSLYLFPFQDWQQSIDFLLWLACVPFSCQRGGTLLERVVGDGKINFIVCAHQLCCHCRNCQCKNWFWLCLSSIPRAHSAVKGLMGT